MKDFFISYTGADQQWAEWIAWQLDAAGYAYVFQAWDFRPGGNFIAEMHKGLIEAERVIAVLSPRYFASRFGALEWQAALADKAIDKLVPVRIEQCDVEGLLRAIIYIDLVGADEATAKQKLLDGVKRGRAKPTTAPAFPTRTSATTPPPRFPGTLPPIWNVPNRNPNFTGRAQLLVDLHATLASGKSAALTALHGLGGIGKTQTAIEYAHRHASEYAIVWWVRSENLATLASDLAQLAQELDLAEKDAQDQRIVIDAVHRALRQRNDWLIVFDNATNQDAVHPFLPQGAGQILITSRHHAWKRIATPLEVTQLERGESIDFLLRRTNAPSPSEGEGRGEGRSDANALADALGDLPLALEQAGAYIDACASSMAEYLALFSARHLELFKRDEAKPLDYPDTVATTWNLAFEQIARDAPAAELFNLCAFFAPDDIPLDLIAPHVGATLVVAPKGREEKHPERSEAESKDTLNRALATLLRFSLVTKNDDATISIHRLVQAVTRDRLTDDESKRFAESAVKIVNDVFPGAGFENDPTTWNVCARLLPHALVTADSAATLNAVPETIARLFNQAGFYLKIRAQFTEAKQLFERALKIDEAAFGPDHPNVAIYVNNLGTVLQDLGDLPAARAHLERALMIDEAAFGPNHPRVATDVNNLGEVLSNLGDLPAARAHFERALKIDEAAFGPNHPKVAIRVNNLGSVLQALGYLNDARAAFERAARIDEAAFGPNHPNVAIRVNNLGMVMKNLGDFAGARAHFERVVKIFEASLGANHPNVATAANNLGLVLQALGDFSGAHAHYERALKIWETSLGENHPQVAIGVNNLGGVLRNLGDLNGARANYERALKIFSQFLPADHPNIKTVRGNLEALDT